MASNLNSVAQKLTSPSHLKQLHSQLITAGKFQSQFCPSRSKLIELYALPPLSDIRYARFIFRQIDTPSTNDFNAVLRGLAASHEPTAAVSWYRLILRGSNRTDALTCSFALKACSRALARTESVQIHSQVLRCGFMADALLGTTLLDVFAKVGDLVSAKKMFDEMSVRDIASWNALIAGLAQGNLAGEAIELFQKMRLESLFKPNEITVLGALSACSNLGALREGEKIHEYIRNEGFDHNVIVCNALIDMYAKCGFVYKAFEVFDSIKCKRNVVTWNAIITGFATHGDGAKALELFNQMVQIGMHPDEVTYLAVLCGCNHGGLVDDGVKLFESMAKCGVKPNMKHYGTVVDLLGRAGKLQEAYGIIKSMPMVADVVLWQSLLGASQIYGNVEMAETASKKLVELGSNNCGDFVLLSNVYAAHERWNDVGRVREAMKNREVKKIPGFSYIEVNGVIHKFFTSDKSHERWKEIYEKLDEIRFRIKEYGYEAGTGYVLHDIGEEDKENVLCHHSEKLAVAFGLIGTMEGTLIQVFKNLRICGDCHDVIKFVSKIYNREIIVRDRVRFHRFIDGSCSCKDYW